MEKLFKTGKAAKFLGVTTRTLKRWAKSGTFVPVKTAENGYNFYSQSQLMEFKKRDMDVIPLTKNSTGDNSKPMTQMKTYDKTYDTNREIGVTAPFVKMNNEDENQEILINFDHIPPKTMQNREIGVTAPLTENENRDVDPDVTVTSNVTVVQIIPANKMVLPNDKFAKNLFNYSQDEYIIVLENGGEVVEVKKFPKVGEIVSEYEIKLINDYSNTLPLTMFDKVILTACISEWCKGNKVTTPSIIFRHITGNDNSYNIKPSPEMEQAILDSVKKMMCTQVTYEMDSACKHLKYNNGQTFKVTAPILPCQYSTGIAVCGQETKNVIEFYKESPLLTIALAKNKQVLSFEKKLLNVPKQHNSVDSISVKHYVVQRVLEIIKHNLKPSITFDDIFKKCGLIDADKKKKFNVRTEIIELLTCMKNSGDIDSFTLKKEGNKYVSIEFYFSSNKKTGGDI